MGRFILGEEFFFLSFFYRYVIGKPGLFGFFFSVFFVFQISF